MTHTNMHELDTYMNFMFYGVNSFWVNEFENTTVMYNFHTTGASPFVSMQLYNIYRHHYYIILYTVVTLTNYQ